MSATEAAAYGKYYGDQKTAATYKNGGIKKGDEDDTETVEINYKTLGYDNYTELSTFLSEYQKANGNSTLYNKLLEWVETGCINEAAMDALYLNFSKEEEATPGQEEGKNGVLPDWWYDMPRPEDKTYPYRR